MQPVIKEEEEMSTDRLAEELDRRADSINLSDGNCASVPVEVEEALRIIKSFCRTNDQLQSCRHSPVYFVNNKTALIEWD